MLPDYPKAVQLLEEAARLEHKHSMNKLKYVKSLLEMEDRVKSSQ